MEPKKKADFKLPPEWIERIFARLTDIFGEQFTSQFKKPEYMEIEKTRWCTGLYGLNTDEIKHVINMCLTNQIRNPPNVVEFFHYGKKWKKPTPRPPERTERDKQVASEYLGKIRTLLHGKTQSHSNTSLPYQRK